MEYKGLEYNVLQTLNPRDWIWTVRLDEERIKKGRSYSRARAIRLAQKAIDQAIKEKEAQGHGE